MPVTAAWMKIARSALDLVGRQVFAQIAVGVADDLRDAVVDDPVEGRVHVAVLA